MAESRNSIVVVVIVPGSIDSLNVTLTVVVILTSVAPLDGDALVTFGGVLSGGGVTLKTRSTQ